MELLLLLMIMMIVVVVVLLHAIVVRLLLANIVGPLIELASTELLAVRRKCCRLERRGSHVVAARR